MATVTKNGKKLVIVESPAKARTIGRILGNDYVIEASMGHVRDLPQKKLGIDVTKDFAPEYEVLPDKEKVVRELKRLAKDASAIYLATDPDREGEAISWHLLEAAHLRTGAPIRRVVFHEITPEAVSEAFAHPRDIDINLVNAQQARRLLDRLVGYKLSPLLWRKVQKGLSAGRVQSVAVRLVVDREREIKGFTPIEYWVIEVQLTRTPPAEGTFKASLVSFEDGARADLGNTASAGELARQLESALYEVASVQARQAPRNPPPPFMTSTLQQEAWRKLRFTAERTMSIAQQLYEGVTLGDEGSVGLITYMRTDSTHVAESALKETRDYIKTAFGASYLPPSERHFARKSKWTQEAHEAIRPTKIHREPSAVARFLDLSQQKLYELIWKRMVASQMASAVFDNVTVDVRARPVPEGRALLLRATSSDMKFPGFMKVYVEGRDDVEPEETGFALPHLEVNEKLNAQKVLPQQRFTQPPPRYTEATLVKALEQKGIGRPSTYAPILSTIQKRDYVHKDGGKFHADELGTAVTDLLAQNFPRIVDLDFTAKLEEELDEVAHGRKEWQPLLRRFYKPFEESLTKAADIKRISLDQETDEICPECGKPMKLKMGRFGKFLACSGFPACRKTKPFLVHIGVNCPECGKPLVQRKSKKKRIFYGCSGYPECKFTTRFRPVAQPCPQCGKLLLAQGKDRVKCTACEYRGKEQVGDPEPEVVAA